MNVSATSPSTRLLSLDALRGFDMFWILGADALVMALGETNQSAPVRFLVGQLEHKEWEGFAFYDLIFPLFVFIVGVSLVFSLTSVLARDTRGTAVKRILRRAALLFLLGIFYNGGLTHAWPEVRLVGVLQRIALAYAAAGILFCYCKPRALAAITAALLLGYWALLALVPIRDIALDRTALVARLPGTPVDAKGFPDEAKVRAVFEQTTQRVKGHYEAGLNVPNHVDYVYLPGGRYDHYYDPEGIVSTLPAIATCLLGVFAGLVLRRGDLPAVVKLQRLLLAGVVLLVAGWLWDYEFPVIKKLWTSSYVLVAGGWSFLLLAAFYYAIDIRQWRRWCQPFVWIGMNPITLYLLSSIVSFHAIASRLVGGSVAQALNARVAPGAGAILVAAVSLAVVFGVARFLYMRKIFLRV
jgi:predicted acyltransferase